MKNPSNFPILFVDASCRGNPGPMEYRVLDQQGHEIFRSQIFPLGTNNLGEFLALVDAAKILKNFATQPDHDFFQKIGRSNTQKKSLKNFSPNLWNSTKLSPQNSARKPTEIPGEIFTDSRTALARLRTRRPKTTLPHSDQTALLHQKIQTALARLRDQPSLPKISKRDTDTLGEIPADFGRK